MLDQVLNTFNVVPDYDLSIMKQGQTLFDITTGILEKIKAVLEEVKPDIVLVHGDTSTTFVTALACFYLQIPVGHVEAGLRTYNIYSPYPEEFNRQAVGIISQYNFAPTQMAADMVMDMHVKELQTFLKEKCISLGLLNKKADARNHMIKNLIKRLIYGYKGTSASYIKHLRRGGVEIGSNVVFHNPQKITIDEMHPYMIKIGNNVNITGGVTILAHDYSSIAARTAVPESTKLGNIRSVSIGNDVFIGWGVTVLAGTVIGDNVIIGAGSVVSGCVESNSVYAGVPARKIMSIDLYVKKLENRQICDAIDIYNNYCDRYNCEPPVAIFYNYKNLFDNSFSSFEDFKKYCKREIESKK